jgi:hypothetical protein
LAHGLYFYMLFERYCEAQLSATAWPAREGQNAGFNHNGVQPTTLASCGCPIEHHYNWAPCRDGTAGAVVAPLPHARRHRTTRTRREGRN